VIALVARGHSNKLIAYGLGLHVGTVATHLARPRSPSFAVGGKKFCVYRAETVVGKIICLGDPRGRLPVAFAEEAKAKKCDPSN
jgi:hypothetical protein